MTEEAPAPETTTVAPPPENNPAPQGPPENCVYVEGEPQISEGSSGPAVRQAQCYLNLVLTGEKLTEDGVFGPVTEAATKRFQECAGIAVDGVIGPQTWSHLVSWAYSGTYVC